MSHFDRKDRIPSPSEGSGNVVDHDAPPGSYFLIHLSQGKRSPFPLLVLDPPPARFLEFSSSSPPTSRYP